MLKMKIISKNTKQSRNLFYILIILLLAGFVQSVTFEAGTEFATSDGSTTASITQQTTCDSIIVYSDHIESLGCVPAIKCTTGTCTIGPAVVTWRCKILYTKFQAHTKNAAEDIEPQLKSEKIDWTRDFCELLQNKSMLRTVLRKGNVFLDFGTIDFSNVIHGNITETVNFDEALNISDTGTKVTIKGFPTKSGNISINRTTVITIRNLTYTNPEIYKDGVLCPSSICTNIKHNKTSETFSFNVSGFSEYVIIDAGSPPPPPPPPPDNGGSSGGGGGGGGGSIAKEIILTKDWKTYEYSAFDKPFFSFKGIYRRMFLDNFDDKEIVMTIQPVRQVVSIKTGTIKAMDLDVDSELDIEIKYHGKSGYKAKLSIKYHETAITPAGPPPTIVEKTVETVAETVDKVTQPIQDVIEVIDEEVKKKIPFITYILVVVGAFTIIGMAFLLTHRGTRFLHHRLLLKKYGRHIAGVKPPVIPVLKISPQSKKQLTSYIQKCRSWHYPKIRIKTALLRIGWKEEIIDELMKGL